MLTIQGLNRQESEASDVPLLMDVDLHIAAGRCAVISGASGAGKSWLLRAIAALDPNQGHVTLNAKNRNQMTAQMWRKKLCYVAAEAAWWSEYAKDHFDDLTAAKEKGLIFGLSTSLFEQSISRLSAGERQRLGLARALLIDPDVLLLDEPTSALDPKSTSEIETALQAFMEQGKVIALVTHNEAQGGRLGDDFYVMDGGRLATRERPKL